MDAPVTIGFAYQGMYFCPSIWEHFLSVVKSFDDDMPLDASPLMLHGFGVHALPRKNICGLPPGQDDWDFGKAGPPGRRHSQHLTTRRPATPWKVRNDSFPTDPLVDVTGSTVCFPRVLPAILREQYLYKENIRFPRYSQGISKICSIFSKCRV